MTKRPTRQAVVVAGAGLLLVTAGATAQAGWLFVIAAGVLALVAASFVTRHRLRHIRLARSVPARVVMGDDARVGLTVINAGSAHTPLLVVEDSFGAFGPRGIGVERLGPGQRAVCEQVLRATRRGVFSTGEVRLRTAAPFGFAASNHTFTVASSTVVLPRWVELTSFPILEPSSSPSEVLHERARTGAGEEYLGLRDYRPGDPRRFVHWRSSARAGRLVVREYEQEASSRVAVVLAGHDHGTPPESSFETLVSAAASIVVYALSTGHPVDLVRAASGGADRLHEPGRMEALEWLAAAEAVDAPLTPLVHVALARAGKRGTVVVCAPDSGHAGASIDAVVGGIQARGARAIVVMARSSTWETGRGPRDRVSYPLHTPQPGGRSLLRSLERGKDLSECLQ